MMFEEKGNLNRLIPSMDVKRYMANSPNSEREDFSKSTTHLPIEEQEPSPKISRATSTSSSDQVEQEPVTPPPETAVYRPIISPSPITDLKFHNGPIDQRALSSKNPWTLLSDLAQDLIKRGMKVGFTNYSARIKVWRPGVEAPSYASQRDKPELFSGSLAAFPISLIKRFKYWATFGPSYNSGFDGSEGYKYASPSVKDTEQDVRFHIEIHRIKNLPGLYVVEFKRIKGNIWVFKKLYHELIVSLPIKSGHKPI